MCTQKLLRLVAVTTPFICVSVAFAQPVVPFEDVPWVGYNVGISAFEGNPTPLERDPYALTAADFDGDGDVDVAVANYDYASPGGTSGLSGFALLFNDGKGEFGQAVQYTVSTKGHFDIVAADFDEDGDADLALPHSGRIGSEIGNTVIVYANDGTGSFSLSGTFLVQTQPLGIATGDFNADGHIDLVAGSSEFGIQHVSVLIGNGDGGFATQTPVLVGDVPGHVATGDFNQDGFDDLAVESLSELMIVVNDGNGGFLPPVMLTEPGLLDPLIGVITVADVDGNGTLDLLAGMHQNSGPQEADEVVLYSGNGDGTFESPEYMDFMSYATTPESLVAADLDDDGDIDIVLCDWSGRTGDGIVTAFNDGSGQYSGFHHVPAGQGTQDLAVADIDGDGTLDVLSADRMSMAVTVHRNPGDGRLPLLTRRFDTGTSSTLHIATGDVDDDGDLDAFVSGESFGTPGALVKGNGDGTFSEPVIYTHSTGYGRGISTAKLRDLDGDGDLDLLYNDAHTDFHDGYDFYTGLNDGTGTFGPLSQWEQNTCGNGDIDAFDLDNDGDLDVVNTEELGCAGGGNTANKLYVNINNGDATFQSPSIVQISTGPHAIAGADLNSDGNVDLVTTHWMPYGARDFINVHLGNGDGTLQEEIIYEVGRGPRFVVIADLNGDGHPDLATANSSSDNSGRETLTVLLGTGTGAFTSRTDYYAPYSPDLQGVHGLEAGDVDGDGDLDLMMTTVANGVAMYYNDGNAGFSFPHRLGVYWGPWSPVFADFSGDEIPDLLMLTSRPPSGLGRELALLRGIAGQPTAGGQNGPTEVTEHPGGLTLSNVYPNPFHRDARFALAVDRSQQVRVSLFDILGREVQVLHDGAIPAGERTFQIDGRDMSTGSYVLRVANGETVVAKRLMLVR